MRLFDLVKQHHAVRAAAHGLGQLTALVMAEVARRRTQQPGGGVLLLILRHIELEQGLLAAEPAGSKGLGKGGLAHAGGPQKEHGPHGAARLPQPGAAAPDGPGHRRHHEIDSSFDCEAYDCGFAVPNFTPGYAESVESDTAETHCDTLRCTVRGRGEAVVIGCDPNTSLYFTNVHLPAVKYHIPKGHTGLDTEVFDEAD